METFPVDSLDRRLQLIVDRLGFVPKRDFLMQVPYWSAVVEQVECVRKTGIAEVFDTLIPKDYFAEQQVPLPSLEQCLTGATIAVHQKNLLLSKPGTQKTIASLSAVVPIE
ncbi:MAG: hypothetical protein Q7R96_03065, partial [Nanoarchaeota archaeon]|nr:hypothetical protein [Nanoarchaeota archaeon]